MSDEELLNKAREEHLVSQLNAEWAPEFEVWKQKWAGFDPVALIWQIDQSESYEMKRVTVFKMRSGQCALVVERGCSCYEYDDALCDFYPTPKEAHEALEHWSKNPWL